MGICASQTKNQVPAYEHQKENTNHSFLIQQSFLQSKYKLFITLEKMQKKQLSTLEDTKFSPNWRSLSLDPYFKKDKLDCFDTFNPVDIKQGELGDCYFLSSSNILAEVHQQIQKLFRHQEYQSNGRSNIFKSQWKQPLMVLLEKVYAKIYGSYHKIESGLASYALKDLTGAPSELFMRLGEMMKMADQCWDFIEKNNKLKYILAVSSEITNQQIEKDNGNRIVSQHSFKILDAQRVIGSDGHQDRIIKMKNFQGRNNMTRDWSYNSEKWTDELKQRLQFSYQDNGDFWMSVKDFMTEFGQVCVCKFKPDYLYKAIPHQVEKSDIITTQVILMRVYEQSHAFISLTQQDKRFFQKGHQYFWLD
ncbi:unnamed protein product [Paramecium sonneborni]|uniref:Calpain catalytic domain-containing protein n=1 Tax=Paramecium sonneborni TaxID=65129 RepID=A0A8S1RT64_9CILI|nr:unnamed protein product [Paramecium sonneborni]